MLHLAPRENVEGASDREAILRADRAAIARNVGSPISDVGRVECELRDPAMGVAIVGEQIEALDRRENGFDLAAVEAHLVDVDEDLSTNGADEHEIEWVLVVRVKT